MNEKLQQAIATSKAGYEALGYTITLGGHGLIARGLDEIWEGYYENGQKAYTNAYKNDILHGMQYKYYNNGQKQFIINFKDGNLDGEQKMWFANGQQEYIFNYKNGKQHGQQEGWNEDGTQRPSQLWENGNFIK